MSLSLILLTIAVTAVHAVETINLSARGLPFAGVGAQSTAGSARLLIDYQEPQRSQVLDFLFKPSFGASLQHLKVEIGGDAQISCGAEASGQRTANGTDANWSVGYEGWLMAEAKKRNPDILLLGLVYAWPEWVSPGGSSPFASPQTEANAASYMTNWVRGMAQQSLTIDWVGIWNEREFTVSYVLTLRDALDAAGFTSTKIVGSDRFWDPYASAYMNSSALRNATAALSQHYPNCGPTGTGGQCPNAVSPNTVLAHKEYGVPLFSTEDYSCWSDDNAAVHWASKLNNNYIGGNITFFSVWYLATAFYPSVAFWNDGLLRATQPWGGHYELSPTVWATAHYTQFTEPTGWYYLKQGQGSGTFPGGGTFVTLVDSLGNVTIVIEAAGEGLNPWSQQNCNAYYGLNYNSAPSAQNVSFVISGGVVPHTLTLWRSRFQRGSRTVPDVFMRQPDVAVNRAGEFVITVEPDAVYTLSTYQGASKGEPATPVPTSVPFPLPYTDDFEGIAPGKPGRYWSDMQGGFQVTPSGTMKQSVPENACCPFIRGLTGPLAVSIIGAATWRDVEVSIDVNVTATGFAFVGVRSQWSRGFFQGGLALPTGLFLAVSRTEWQLVLDTERLGPQTLGPCDAPNCLMSGSISSNVTRVTLGAAGGTAWAKANGVYLVREITLPKLSTANIGAGFVSVGASFSEVEFDNVTIVATTSGDVSPTPPEEGFVLRGLPCGDPAADAGGRWEMPSWPLTSQLRLFAPYEGYCLSGIVLAACNVSDPNQSWLVTGTSIVNDVSGLCLSPLANAFPGSLSLVSLALCAKTTLAVYWSPGTGYLHTIAQAPLQMVCLGAWGPAPPPQSATSFGS